MDTQMVERPAIRLELSAAAYGRLISGQPTADDDAHLRRQLIAAETPTTNGVPACEISIGGAQDIVIGTKVVLSASEQSLVSALRAALEKIESDEYDLSFRAYISAIREFSSSSYRTLPLPHGRSLDDVYVPATLKALQSDEFAGDFTLAGVFDNSAVSRNKSQVILQGQPGTGKSTLLRQIAKSAWNDPAKLGLKVPAIPMLIRLQSLATSKGVTIEERLLSAIRDAGDLEFKKIPPPDFFTAWPERLAADWLLLLDGLDEVPRIQQEAIKTWISERQRKGSGVFLASRPTNALDSSFCRNFSMYSVETFSPSQQRQLATNLLRSKSDDFLNLLSNVGSDFLFTTPLLITLAATVFDRDGCLPSPRIKLYERMVEQWQDEAMLRAAPGELAPDFQDLVVPALESIALGMTENPNAGSFNAVSGIVGRFLASETGRPVSATSESSRRLLDFITRRSGVLLAFGSHCDWLHRSFREYLAARRLSRLMTAEDAQGSDLFHQWNQDAWTQVLLFLAAMWNHQDVSRLLEPIALDNPPYGLIFCGNALAEGAAVGSEFEAFLIGRLCEAATKNAAGTICVRLLAGLTDDSVVKAEGVLRVLRHVSNRPAARDHFARLLKFLLREARDWHKEQGNAAVNDLGILGRRDELLQLAQDHHVHPWVRQEAMGELVELGTVDAVLPLLISILRDGVSEAIATRVLNTISDCKASEPLKLAAYDEKLSLTVRSHAVDLLGKRGKVDTLKGLSVDRSLPRSIREHALVALANAGEHVSSRQSIQELLQEKEADPDAVTGIVEMLGQGKNWAALADIIICTKLPLIAREQGINILEREKNQDELLALLGKSELSAYIALKVVGSVIKLGDLASIRARIDAFFTSFFETVRDGAALNECHRLRGDYYASMNDHEDALQDYDAILAANPSDEWVFALRGNCLRVLGRYADALKDFDTALRLDPDDRWDLVRRGLTLYALGEYRRAGQDFALALDLGSTETHFLDKYADSLVETSELEKALEVANHSVDSDFLNHVHYAYRADVYCARGEFDAAVADLKQAIMLDSSYAYGPYREGFVLRLKGDLAAARTTLLRALDLNPSHVASRLELVCVSILLHDQETSVQQLREAETDRPDSKRAKYLGWLVAHMAQDLSSEPDSSDGDFLADTSDEFEVRFRVALRSLIAGHDKNATELIESAKVVELRVIVVPEVSLLLAVFQNDSRVVTLMALASKRLQEERARVKPVEETAAESAKLETPTGIYTRWALYCPRQLILGMELQYKKSLALLKANANNRRSIVLLALDGDWVYGQCNFKMNRTNDSDLKFVDRIETVIKRNLKIFVDEGARQMLFVERGLRDRIEEGANDVEGQYDWGNGTSLHLLSYKLVRQ